MKLCLIHLSLFSNFVVRFRWFCFLSFLHRKEKIIEFSFRIIVTSNVMMNMLFVKQIQNTNDEIWNRITARLSSSYHQIMQWLILSFVPCFVHFFFLFIILFLMFQVEECKRNPLREHRQNKKVLTKEKKNCKQQDRLIDARENITYIVCSMYDIVVMPMNCTHTVYYANLTICKVKKKMTCKCVVLSQVSFSMAATFLTATAFCVHHSIVWRFFFFLQKEKTLSVYNFAVFFSSYSFIASDAKLCLRKEN